MRIVAGEFRGRSLAAPPGSAAIRPTSDRLRETLFDILLHRFEDPVTNARVLDLFAGTGALGLEALSRGAACCVLVENSAEARGVIRTNIDALGLTGRARIFRRDATNLGPAGPNAPFNLVFVDPPYRRGLGEAALRSAASGGWLTPGSIIILEEAAQAEMVPLPGFAILDDRRVGDSRARFLRWGGLA